MRRLGAAWSAVRSFVDARDIHYYGGLLLVAAGLYLWEPAAGVAAAGAGLIYAAERTAR